MNVALHPAGALNCISLCSGGGGLDLGVELAIPTTRVVCMVEREAFAVAHLVAAMRQNLLAEAPIWSDVRTFQGRRWRGLVDGVIGGIPCQPHSLAGKRLGEADERDLWSAARRIIVQSGAWFVLIENVGGMLSSGGAERVWRDLRRLGFEVEGGLFTAAEVGASHERERLFILGVADPDKPVVRRLASAGQFGVDEPDDGIGSSALADRDGEHGDGAGERRPGGRSEDSDRRNEVRHAGVGLADPCGEGRQGSGPPGDRQGERETAKRGGEFVGYASSVDGEGEWERGSLRGTAGSGEHRGSGAALEHAQGLGRGEGRPEPIVRSGRRATGQPDDAVVDSIGRGRDGRSQGALGKPQRRTPDEWAGERPLFPPGPGDLGGWSAVFDARPDLAPATTQPRLRGMADGLAGGMDHARIERLRMLGNGVVPLEAAYAVGTLAARLTERAPGAERLVRIVGEST